MIKKITKSNFFKRIFLCVFIVLFLQIIVFNFLKFFFAYKINLSYEPIYFYFYNLLISFIVYFFSEFFYKKDKIFCNFQSPSKDSINYVIKILIILLILGIIFTFVSKYLLFNYYNTFESLKDLSCLMVSIKSSWQKNINFIDNRTIVNIYNILSPFGVIFINFLYILVIKIFIFKKKINGFNKVLILIWLSLLVYFFSNGSKNLIFNYIICCSIGFLLSFIFNNKFEFKLLFINFTFVLLLILFNAESRSKCMKVDMPDYNIDSEFSQQYSDKKDNINNYRDILIKKEKIIIQNETINYLNYYLLTGTLNGEYMIEKMKPDRDHIILKKTINIFLKDFNYQIGVKLTWEKMLGGIGLIYLLWHDYSFFGILIFFIFFYSVLFVINHNRSNQIIRSNLNIFLINLFFLIILFFNVLHWFNWYGLEVMNSRFIFFDILVTFILLSLTQNNKDKKC